MADKLVIGRFQKTITTGMLFMAVLVVAAQKPAVKLSGGRLLYATDSVGNRLVDFSFAGYKASEEPIPNVETKVYVSHQLGDQTARIQKAIDYIGGLNLEDGGFRGAVLLEPGTYEVGGTLRMNHSGVVLRGSGNTPDGTTLLGTGLDRATLIQVAGKEDPLVAKPIAIASHHVPVNARQLEVVSLEGLQVGDEINITRRSTEAWISTLGMNDFGGETDYIGWKPKERNIIWRRKVTAIDGHQLTIDAPLTTAIEDRFGGGFIQKVGGPGRIDNVGIENLRLESTYDHQNPKDEQHRWMAITMESVRDAWVRQVSFRHFAGSAVAVWNTASRVTVEDCKSLQPISEIGGQRRYTFYTEGQQCLFQRLYSQQGYHDFGVGFMAAGPNAFVECQAYLPHQFSGAIDSWASGVLFDLVNVAGGALKFGNRGMEAQGAGWTAANSMMWQCSASLVDCPAPPTAMNYAYAAWGQFAGNGEWHQANSFLKPRSLFYGQLADRLKTDLNSRARLLPVTMEASSSPTVEQALEYTRAAAEPAPDLARWIDLAAEANAIPVNRGQSVSIDRLKTPDIDQEQSRSSGAALHLLHGKLLFGNQLATGNRKNVSWWRGNVRAYDAEKASAHVTRYVPGRQGSGYTDVLEEMVPTMKAQNVTILDHNYGLWYDRRRDDHQRVRRMDGEVWAPFYELPFARSGRGTAWDGLSQYDLTQYNHWYWKRLRDFVEIAEPNEVVLYHQNYFQHNILEAGGHYADFPWRTANNVNKTPFAEPVNYAGDKRIFMAEQFYDLSDPAYRALHQAYIKQCLDNFKGQSNVIQFISAEYTGPLSFLQFWLDVIKEWEAETGEEILIALSATKDVQDAILEDPQRASLVDIIDIRYWWYGEGQSGEIELYAPKGGQNLAPRQHARLMKTPKETFESTYLAVSEYATAYPHKAVIYNTPGFSAFGWAVLLGGGSLMPIPRIENQEFLADLVKMKPVRSANCYQLNNPETGAQVVFGSGPRQSINLTANNGRFRLCWVDPESGNISASNQVLEGGKRYEIEAKTEILWLDQEDE